MTVSERVTRKDIDELRQWFAADAGPDVTRSSYGASSGSGCASSSASGTRPTCSG